MAAQIIPDAKTLADVLAPLRATQTLALANGCFDLLHVGHVRLLQEACEHGDILIVALNTDASARDLKGADRPFVTLNDRMEVIAAIAGVDYVTSFAEPTAHALVEALRPDVYVKGTDRTPNTTPERGLVESQGGRLVFLGGPKERSSTDLGRRD
jgi:D-glycero-beta-D-manno-heptose 1-phosphate adenylyltransferase